MENMHIKMINEPAELVPILRALDTPIKRDVFDEIMNDWKTLSEIEKKYGDEGVEAIHFFEKIKLVDIQWRINSDTKKREKAYRSYYSSFQINASCPINEMKDILTVVIMDDKEFEKYEQMIIDEVKRNGNSVYIGDLKEKFNMSDTMLKALIKRSTKLDYQGRNVKFFNPV